MRVVCVQRVLRERLRDGSVYRRSTSLLHRRRRALPRAALQGAREGARAGRLVVKPELAKLQHYGIFPSFDVMLPALSSRLPGKRVQTDMTSGREQAGEEGLASARTVLSPK